MLPRGGEWEIRGVVKGPRQADPAIHGASWTAWAAGDGQRVDHPLLDLVICGPCAAKLPEQDGLGHSFDQDDPMSEDRG